MIVSDKKATIAKADDTSKKIMSLIIKDAETFECDDDPAEFIYLGCHTLGILISKMSIALTNYAQTYGITDFTIKHLREWINHVADEYIALQEDKK